jgi:uncharacterized protein YgiM (DUF1202 family)
MLTSKFMQTTHPARGFLRPRLCLRIAACLIGLTLAHPSLAQTSSKAPAERVRVPTSHANVHMGPNTTTQVLVLVPKGTVLTVLARDKEWIQVQLTPELRKTGMVMRWYKNEDRGWMHDSTVEVVKP